MKRIRYTLAEEIGFILEESKRDIIDLNMIIRAANDATDASPGLGRMDRTFDLLRTLLARGFQAINMVAGGECQPWPDQRADSVIQWIKADWLMNHDEVLVGYSYWFHLPEDRR
jgi:hypothetical protein